MPWSIYTCQNRFLCFFFFFFLLNPLYVALAAFENLSSLTLSWTNPTHPRDSEARPGRSAEPGKVSVAWKGDCRRDGEDGRDSFVSLLASSPASAPPGRSLGPTQTRPCCLPVAFTERSLSHVESFCTLDFMSSFQRSREVAAVTLLYRCGNWGKKLSDKFPNKKFEPKFVLIPKSKALITLLNWPPCPVSPCTSVIDVVLLPSCPWTSEVREGVCLFLYS